MPVAFVPVSRRTCPDSAADAEALESGKVRCTVTGHEMRPILSELEAHWASKTYLKKKERAEYDFDQHAPWLVPMVNQASRYIRYSRYHRYSGWSTRRAARRIK